MRLASPYFLKPCTTTAVLPRLEPDVRYSAPELTTGGYSNSNVRYLTPTSDIFSLGMLAYEVYQFNLKGSVSMDAPMRTHIPILNIQGKTHSLTRSLTHSLTHSLTQVTMRYCMKQPLGTQSQVLTHSPNHLLTYSPNHLLTHSSVRLLFCKSRC